MAANVLKVAMLEYEVHLVPHFALMRQLYAWLDRSPVMTTELRLPSTSLVVHLPPGIVGLYCTCHCTALTLADQFSCAVFVVILVAGSVVAFWHRLQFSSVWPLQFSSMSLPQISAAPG